MSEAGTCVTCGAELVGPYCYACGEKVLEPEDLRVGTFVRRAAASAFDADSRLWRTFHSVLFRPGELTVEFVRGRRAPYVHPLQLFLLCNLILFLSLRYALGFSTFTTRVEWHVTQPFYGPIALEMIENRAPAGSPESAEYVRRFDEATPNYANSMVLLMVPLVAVGVALLFIRRREPFVKHLVFALHFMTFLLLLSTLLPYALWLLVAILPGLGRYANSDLPVSLLMSVILSVWFGVAIWRAYGDRPILAFAKGLASTMILMPALILYRAILFFAVYLTLD